MRLRKIWLALFMWVWLAIIAIINGIIRNSLYKGSIGELAAHQVSSLSYLFLAFFSVYSFIRKTKGMYSKKESILLGLSWASMTIAFEFIFGHYVAGNSWEILLHDYNLFEGRLWVLVLTGIAAFPRASLALLEKKQ